MKSPMIETMAPFIKDQDNYSELQVCKSAAGYYVGTMYNNSEGFQEPGSRESNYFRTKEEAEKYLAMVENSINPQEYLRDQP